jgi:hypothetical protein
MSTTTVYKLGQKVPRALIGANPTHEELTTGPQKRVYAVTLRNRKTVFALVPEFTMASNDTILEAHVLYGKTKLAFVAPNRVFFLASGTRVRRIGFNVREAMADL